MRPNGVSSRSDVCELPPFGLIVVCVVFLLFIRPVLIVPIACVVLGLCCAAYCGLFLCRGQSSALLAVCFEFVSVCARVFLPYGLVLLDLPCDFRQYCQIFGAV